MACFIINRLVCLNCDRCCEILATHQSIFKGFVQGFLEAFDSMSPVGSMFDDIGNALGVWKAVKSVQLVYRFTHTD